ncbi:MAG: signal peptidase I [Chloroflexi bacterium]|nr:signal peptidase I [Chloroflexota bacterium]
MFAVNIVVDQRHVEGASMAPTLTNGQYVLTNKLAYTSFVPRAFAGDHVDQNWHGSLPHRGDIVILRRPNDPEARNLVKRVIALPGETVEVRNGTIYVNGETVDEPYVLNRDRGSITPVTVPANHVYVMGDNRPVSSDSRAFGPVPMTDILGRAWFRYWPLDQLGLLPAA